MADDTDITELILADHERFRRAFAELDELRGDPGTPDGSLSGVWEPLAALLDLHAVAEEEVFYPQLLRRGDDAEEETLDAIGDHNDIRDATHDAGRQPVGAPAWWSAVGRAREANDEHMAEEEREGLSDFRRNAPVELRRSLGRGFLRFKDEHSDVSKLDTSDKDPEEYVDREEHAAGMSQPGGGNSLRIGSLKGR